MMPRKLRIVIGLRSRLARASLSKLEWHKRHHPISTV
eukprot:UN02788